MNQEAADVELVRRVQAGDTRAFDLLVQKYQHKILHLIGRYVHDPVSAQDVAQEAFIKAYRGLRNFRGDSAFYTWLYRIAINTAKNFLVTESRRTPDYEVNAEDAEHLNGESGLKEYATPERELLSEEIKRQIFKAMEDLPEDLRSAIVLRELEGMSYEEIAQVMECPIGTVRSRIFRAREAIDRQLRPLLG
ncbi:MAG: RNA polymerase sigma factor RpoE [Acidihalobacter sp.]|jgi:RNA polymerase sigma-70 factor, ECF subfamily